MKEARPLSGAWGCGWGHLAPSLLARAAAEKIFRAASDAVKSRKSGGVITEPAHDQISSQAQELVREMSEAAQADREANHEGDERASSHLLGRR